MSKAWRQTTLGQICVAKSGESNTQDAVENGPYVFFDRSKTPKKSIRYLFDCEALIVAGEGAEFLPKYFIGKFDLHQRAYAIHDFSPDVHPRYVFYWLHHRKEYLPSVAVGATVKSLRQRHFDNFPIALPPLSEQKRIVAFLDEAFAGIAKATANAERNLANADELFDSELQTLIDYAEGQRREATFADVCDITSSLVDPKLGKFQNLPHVGGGNIVTKSDNLIDLKTAKEEKLISGKFLFDESMVLYSKIRPYLMKVSRPDFSGLCSADVYPLSPRKNILDRDYLFFVLLSKKFTEYAISGSGRAGMPKVNRNHLFAYTLKVPSLSVQKEIVQKLNQTMAARDNLKEIYSKKQAALIELKSSLLHQAFSGKLTGKEAEAA